MPSMPSLGRAPKLIVVAVVVVGAAVAVLNALSTQKRQILQLQRQLATTQQQVAQAEAQNQTLSGELTSLQAERKTLDERITSLKTQLSSAQTELDRSRVSLEEFQGRTGTLEGEKAQLETRVTELISEREEARQRADKAAEEKAHLERVAGRMRERMNLLDRDYRALSAKVADMERSSTNAHPGVNLVAEITANPAAQSAVMPAVPSSVPDAVELPPIVVRKGQSAISVPIRGRLVELNESHNFAVVDKGSQDGVYPGMVFEFQRGTATVGVAKVIRVRPQLAACDIVRDRTPGPLQVGDVAVQGR